jgi:hypothetical protein
MKSSDLAKVNALSANLDHLKSKIDYVETESWTLCRVLADGSIEPADPRVFNQSKIAIGARSLLKNLTQDEINACQMDLVALGVDFDDGVRRLPAPQNQGEAA